MKSQEERWRFQFFPTPKKLAYCLVRKARLDMRCIMKSQEERWRFQFFPTPKKLAYCLVRKARLDKNDIVLEPSAGRGAILQYIRRFPHKEIHCCELNDLNCDFLEKEGYSLLSKNFLSVQEYGFFTKIIANPPFTDGQDQKHIRKMYEILAHGGRMVSLCSGNFLDRCRDSDEEFYLWLKDKGAKIEVLPSDAFQELNVSVKIVLIVIDK